MSCTHCIKCFPVPSRSSKCFTRLSVPHQHTHSYTRRSQNEHVCPSARVLGIVIALVLLLAFVERPSSLSSSSDARQHSARWQPPCGLTESIEFVCLLVFFLDIAAKVNTTGLENISTLLSTICRKKRVYNFWKC